MIYFFLFLHFIAVIFFEFSFVFYFAVINHRYIETMLLEK